MDSLSSSPEKNSISESGSVSFQIYEQLRAEIQHLKQELVAISEQNVDLAIQLGQIDQLNGVVVERNGQIEHLNRQTAALNQTITDLKLKLSQETEHAQKSDLRIEELLALEAELRANLKSSQEECLDLKGQIERHLVSIANLQEALAQVQASNARHLAALESLEAYISKPEEEEQEDIPPLVHLKNTLQDVLGTAGQVIFNRACRLVGIESHNGAAATFEQLQKATMTILDPALRLCRNKEMAKDLQKRLHSICASVGPIEPELEEALSNSGPATSIASSVDITAKDREPLATTQAKSAPLLASETAQDDAAEAETSDDDEEEEEEEVAQDDTAEAETSDDDEEKEEVAQDDAAEAETSDDNEEGVAQDDTDEAEASDDDEEKEEVAQDDTAEAETSDDNEEEEEEEEVAQDDAAEAEADTNPLGDQLVRDTEVPNRTLSDKRAQEFNNTFKTILEATQSKFQDHVVGFIYKMTWQPSQISERDRACTRPKQINKLSQSIIRSCVDFDLDQIVEWLNYLVMPKRINTYVPEAHLAQLSNIHTRQDSQVQDLLNVVEALNKRIFRKDRLKVYFFDGPGMYLTYTKAKEPHLYFNNEIVNQFNQAQLTFFASRALFSLQRGYFELETALQSITQQPDYDPLGFGSTLLKRSLALASEKAIAIPANLAEEIQNAWNIESNQELLDLVDRCYKATKFAQFSYIKELLSTPTPFQQSMNIEGDAFTLKFCNIYDASLAIVKLLSGCKAAERYSQEGFNQLFTNRKQPQTYLQQRLSNLWLSYYINGDEFAF